MKWLRVNDIRGYLQSNRNGLKKGCSLCRPIYLKPKPRG
nr:MAG TPA: hypothetical protein [Caudoviricetes sp.]